MCFTVLYQQNHNQPFPQGKIHSSSGGSSSLRRAFQVVSQPKNSQHPIPELSGFTAVHAVCVCVYSLRVKVRVCVRPPGGRTVRLLGGAGRAVSQGGRNDVEMTRSTRNRTRPAITLVPSWHPRGVTQAPGVSVPGGREGGGGLHLHVKWFPEAYDDCGERPPACHTHTVNSAPAIIGGL